MRSSGTCYKPSYILSVCHLGCHRKRRSREPLLLPKHVEVFVELLLRTCRSSNSVVDIFHREPQSLNGRNKSLGRTLHDLNAQQWFPKQNPENMSTIFLAYLEGSLTFENIVSNSRYTFESSNAEDATSVSLIRWCAEVVINASQKAYFGDCLINIDLRLAQTFVELDTRSWQILYRFPRVLSRKMYSAKDKLIKALALYFSAPAETKADAAWVTKLLEKEMRQLGFSNQEMATLMMLQYWG